VSLDVQKLGVKFFLTNPSGLDLLALIPVFHGWIQNASVDGLLIDVADYSHLPRGPGIMLIAHEGDYALDMGGGRPGLMYRRKTPLEGGLGERLSEICRIALRACVLLESDAGLEQPAFRGDTLSIVAHDRLLAPNTAATLEQLRPSLEEFAHRLFGEGGHRIEAALESEDPFSVTLSTQADAGVSALLARVSG
jgi:hypothetical protein